MGVSLYVRAFVSLCVRVRVYVRVVCMCVCVCVFVLPRVRPYAPSSSSPPGSARTASATPAGTRT